MPSGSYLLSGHDGPYAVERFSCAAGPAGWRYVATREQPGTGAPLGSLEVVLDVRGTALRVQVETRGWLLRGGVVGPDALWRRGDVERSSPAAGYTGSSPVWVLATTRLLARATAAVSVRLVRLGDEALATSVVDERWERTGSSRHDGLDVERWVTADLGSGEQRVVHVAGELVLTAPGVSLLDLDRAM